MSAIGFGSSGDEALCLNVAFRFDRVEANEIKRDVSQDGEVVRGMLLWARIWSSPIPGLTSGGKKFDALKLLMREHG